MRVFQHWANQVITVAALASSAFAGGAHAADLAPRYAKASAPARAVANWTGCYLGAGAGYGMWNQENVLLVDFGAGPVPTSESAGTGGRGHLATVQAGCDYQFVAAGANFVVGAFADYDFTNQLGTHNVDILSTGTERMRSAWSVGGRAGVLVGPSHLIYVTGGFSEAQFDRINLTAVNADGRSFFLDGQAYQGYFVGAGDEIALNLMPGLFWKTEYRFADLGLQRNAFRSPATGLPIGAFADSHKYAQSVRGELIYRLNWGRPGQAASVAPVPAVNWTGCYVGAGGGYGMWNQHSAFFGAPGLNEEGEAGTAGGRGFFGTAQLGCDYQLSRHLVAGAFADYDWANLKGVVQPPATRQVGEEKQSSGWSAGGRIGWVATPSLLAYFTGGYAAATFESVKLRPFALLDIPSSASLDGRSYRGYFVGAGNELALGILPGLFLKTEYRFSQFNEETLPIRDNLGLGPQAREVAGVSTHTVRSELVYRFNWGGSAAAVER